MTKDLARTGVRVPEGVGHALAERGFRTAPPTGDVIFYMIVTTKENLPLAHGRIVPGRWKFIDGKPGFIAHGEFLAVASGKPEWGWTFTVDGHGNAGLLTDGPVEMPEVTTGDPVSITNDLTLPTQPLPAWIIQ